MSELDKFGLPLNLLSSLCTIFKKYPQVQKVILYGSRATGSYKNSSDIDITLVAPDASLSDMFKMENEIDDLMLPYKVDLSLFHKLENEALVAHIHKYGQEIHNLVSS
jgi:predicted nucleotidyltransferase